MGEPYFDRMGAPIGLMLLFLMAIAPALPWRATSAEVLQNRLLLPAIAGVAAMLRDRRRPGRATGPRWWRSDSPRSPSSRSGARRSSRCGPAGAVDGGGWLRALGRTYAGNPRRYGGLVVHTGVVAIAVVLAAGGSFGTKQEVRLTRGQSAAVGGYRITYVDRRIHRERAEERRLRRPAGDPRRRRPRHVRPRDLHVPRTPPPGSARRRCGPVCSRTCT